MVFVSPHWLPRFAGAARSAAKTLRLRLMVWNAGLILVTAIACFVGIREGLRRTLVSEMDKVLSADLREISLEVNDLQPTAPNIRKAKAAKEPTRAAQLLQDLNRKASGHLHSGWFVELLDDRGESIWRRDRLRCPSISRRRLGMATASSSDFPAPCESGSVRRWTQSTVTSNASIA